MDCMYGFTVLVPFQSPAQSRSGNRGTELVPAIKDTGWIGAICWQLVGAYARMRGLVVGEGGPGHPCELPLSSCC